MKKAKKVKAKKERKVTNFNTDKRRKHRHFLVTVFYADGERFGRVYTDRPKQLVLQTAKEVTGREVCPRNATQLSKLPNLRRRN